MTSTQVRRRSRRPLTTEDIAMSIVADQYSYVVGVDTHAATHTFAVIESPSGKHLETKSFSTSAAGLSRAGDWIGRLTGGDLDGVLVSAEGTGSYGAVMADRLAQAGYRVVEAPTPSSKRLRGAGKTDAADALTAARATMVMGLNQLRDRRSGQLQSALTLLTVAREQMNTQRLAVINALTALVRTHDLGVDARRSLKLAQIRTIATWRHRNESLAVTVARAEAVRLATQILGLNTDLKSNHQQINDLVAEHSPELLKMPGIGAVSAAQILVVWSHPGRIRSEAALAAIAGTSPIPASSGNTTRHRLNRGGDRRLNRAFYTVALTRMGHDPDTRAYVQRRTAQGHSKREIMRCLKRYITRQVYRTLTTHPPLPVT